MTKHKEKLEKLVNPVVPEPHTRFKNGIYRNTLRVKADKPDINDYKFKNAFIIDRSNWKARTDNAARIKAPYDQGQLGSCTANSLGKHIEYVHNLSYDPSRLFIYYNERALEGTIDSDSGAELRDGIKVVSKLGVVPEEHWPYDVSKFTVKPPEEVYAEGLKELVHKYYRVEDTDDLYQSLSDGYLVSFGFTCYDNFDSKEVADTGFLPLPKRGQQSIGGHAVLAVDYGLAKDFLTAEMIKRCRIDPELKVIKVLNSWGEGWGLNGSGYFLMPIQYFKNPNLVSDLWTIRPN